MISSTDRVSLGRWTAALALALCAGGSALATPQQIGIARDAVGRGDTIAADVALDRVEAAGASRRSIAVLRGENCLLEGNLACARQWLGPGEFAEGEALRGFQLLGRLERRAGDPAAAARAYDRALAIDNRNADLWVDIAEFRYAGSEEALAFDALAFALRNDPSQPRALALQARLVRDRDGWQPSLPFFEQAIDYVPSDTALLLDYSATLGEAGRARTFLAASRSAAERGGTTRALYQQAVLAARAGDFDTARTLMERVPPGREERGVATLRAIVAMETGSLRSAQQQLERLYNRVPEDRVVTRLYARALSLGDRNSAIVTIFGRKAARANADPYLKTIVARALERVGRRGAAAALLDSAPNTVARGFAGIEAFGPEVGAVAYRANPARFVAVRDYVRGLVGTDQTELARSVSGQLVKRFPDTRDAHVLAGDAALADRDMRAALEHYERAAAIRFTDRLLVRIVGALEASARADEARRVAQSYLARRPGNALASRIVAVQAANAGDWALARSVLGNLLEGAGSRDVVLLSLASQAAANLGEGEEAVTLAERAMDLQPNNRLAAASLAFAHERNGLSREESRRRAGLNADASRFPRAFNRLREAARGG